MKILVPPSGYGSPPSPASIENPVNSWHNNNFNQEDRMPRAYGMAQFPSSGTSFPDTTYRSIEVLGFNSSHGSNLNAMYANCQGLGPFSQFDSAHNAWSNYYNPISNFQQGYCESKVGCAQHGVNARKRNRNNFSRTNPKDNKNLKRTKFQRNGGATKIVIPRLEEAQDIELWIKQRKERYPRSKKCDVNYNQAGEGSSFQGLGSYGQNPDISDDPLMTLKPVKGESLLRSLLRNDINLESIKILQCLNYIATQMLS